MVSKAITLGVSVRLTIRVSLNFNNHLLQSPDALFAALLGHLVLEITLGTLVVFTGLVLRVLLLLLGVFRKVLICSILEGVDS